MRAWIRRHRITSFLAVTFAVTWGAWIPFGLSGHRVGLGASPLYLLGMFGPAIGAVTTLAICDGAKGLRGLRRRLGRVRVGGRYWLVALGLPIGIFALVYLALVMYSMFLLAPIAMPTRQTITHVAGLPPSGLVGLCALLFALALGEEIGWRGFLQQELQRRHSPVVASLIVAACWAPWHAPLFVISAGYRAMPLAMIPLWVIALIGLSIVLGWLYSHGRHSILLVAAAHAAFNLTTASAAAGPIAVLETIAVMVFAAWIARHERTSSQRASLRLLPFVSVTTERRPS